MVRIANEWAADIWETAVLALNKEHGAYEAWGERLCQEFGRHRFKGGGVAIDIGCGEGAFTEVWLRILIQGKIGLPSTVYLVEDNKELLDQAEARLRRAFRWLSPPIEFKLIQKKFALTDDAFFTEKYNLIVASHVSYYFTHTELEAFLSKLQQDMLAPGGVAWIVVRDRNCGFYRTRFEILSRSGVRDEQADQFSDHLLHIVRQRKDLVWTTQGREFKLATEKLVEEERQRVFCFLAHLVEEQPGELRSFITESSVSKRELLVDWRNFSETHILVSGLGEASPSEDFPEDRDVSAHRLLIDAHDVLVRYELGILDLELARIEPGEEAHQGGPGLEQVSGVDFYHPHPIKGLMRRWGWRRPVQGDSGEREKALLSYFARYPSFLLFPCFFSLIRRPCISEPLIVTDGKLADISHRVESFKHLRTHELDWKEEWRAETFDVAWASWCDIVRKRFASIQFSGDKNGKLEIRCLAVPARLSEWNAVVTPYAAVLNASAALFATVIGERTDVSLPNASQIEEIRLLRLELAYREIASLLMAYAGESVSKELFETRQKVEQDRQRLFSLNARLEEVRQSAEELSRVLSERAQPIATKIMTLTGAECILDAKAMRRLFHEPSISLLKDDEGNDLVRSLHRSIHASDESELEAWLGFAIAMLVNQRLPESLISRENILLTAQKMVSQEQGFLRRCMVDLLRRLIDRETVYLGPSEQQLTMAARGHSFLKMLIDGPGTTKREASMFSLAVRLLTQARSDELEIEIEGKGEVKVSLNAANMTNPEVAKFFYYPTFPDLEGIAHSQWFEPLVALVTKVFRQSAEYKVYVNRVCIAKKDYSVTCILDEKAEGKGSLQAIEDSLSEVRKAYPETGEGEWGDLRSNLEKLVDLEQDERYRQQIQLEVKDRSLRIHLNNVDF